MQVLSTKKSPEAWSQSDRGRRWDAAEVRLDTARACTACRLLAVIGKHCFSRGVPTGGASARPSAGLDSSPRGPRSAALPHAQGCSESWMEERGQPQKQRTQRSKPARQPGGVCPSSLCPLRRGQLQRTLSKGPPPDTANSVVGPGMPPGWGCCSRQGANAWKWQVHGRSQRLGWGDGGGG